MRSLDVYIDFKSAPAYLSLQPTLTLAQHYDLRIVWRPFVTRQRTLEAATDDESKGARHIRVREQARRETHLRYAALQNIDLGFRDPPGRTEAALSALLHPLPAVSGYLDHAFRAYWQEGADLDDVATVHSVLEASGNPQVDVENLAADLAIAQQAAIDNGIIDTPTYVLGDELFVGREHLPWIREAMGGR